MYTIDISRHFNNISSFYKGTDEEDEIKKLFHNLVFKLEKNLYHFNAIKNSIKKLDEDDEFFDLITIYFEAESLLITMRSTIDMNLHLVNFCLDLGIPGNEVYIQNIYKSKLPNALRDIFNRYTTRRNNPTWNFIYKYRNEIVHENSIYQILPLEVMNIENRKLLFTKLNNQDREVVKLFRECMTFLDNFTQRILTTLNICLNAKKNS